jgi:hypothetical protein
MRRLGVLLVVLGLGAAGCGDDDGEGSGGGGGTGGGGGDSGGVILNVFVAGETVASWTLADLEEAVVFTTLTIDGDEQSGPLLIDVLAASGVDGWEQAEVLGKGEGRSFDVGVEIEANAVDDGWILDVTNRGTLKLAAEALPREQWVRDVGEIRIP